MSPHAPYSVHPQLFHAAVELAVAERAPLTIHLAETRAELELLEHGTGPFVEMLKQFGVWRNDAIPRRSRPMDYLRPLESLDRALVVHGNYLDDADLDFLAEHENLTLVYCPRTHAYFGHDPHPWLRLLERGGRVALGTDSRASNSDLDLWKEVLFLRERFPGVAPQQQLDLATCSGARAMLGSDCDAGTLAVGNIADVATIALPDVDARDPWEMLFHSAGRAGCIQVADRG